MNSQERKQWWETGFYLKWKKKGLRNSNVLCREREVKARGERAAALLPRGIGLRWARAGLVTLNL